MPDNPPQVGSVPADSALTLVVLHGHGGSPDSAAALAAGIDPTFRARHVTPAGPIDLGAGARAWFEGGDASSIRGAGAAVRTLLDEVDGPTVVVGWSQGGAAALAALALDDTATPSQHPCVGLALLGSFLADAPGLDYDPGRLADLPVLIQHGRDDDVVPAFFAEDLAATLSSAGVEVEHREVPLAHELDDAAIADVAEWVATRWKDVT